MAMRPPLADQPAPTNAHAITGHCNHRAQEDPGGFQPPAHGHQNVVATLVVAFPSARTLWMSAIIIWSMVRPTNQETVICSKGLTLGLLYASMRGCSFGARATFARH